ncbi:hypothetical protein [Clostridium estertheticum]|uniref:Uncharacterized protein n=1 Tax=Clostridium estertheticum TaxID=238834 RepID=A0AA47EHR5_9CLOT|nr:hypothetical protein [Clostridium estertheticum]MBU3156347.1 hypothetical protein [Clostridium estertheticum]WAG59614.1 hypothetical protein LL038_18560 [Clostridium estertheticum]
MIIDFSSKQKKNIRYIHKSVLVGRKGQERYRVMIMLENKNTGIKVPHPLTEFLSNYNHLEHSSVIQKANYVIPFLNYIFFNDNQSYKLKSLSDITFEHGVDFLNDFSKGNIGRNIPNRDTVKIAEKVLTQFYEFLLEKKLLNNSQIMLLCTAEFYHQNKGWIKYKKSPFKGVCYPRNKRSNKLSSIPMELVIAFIDIAIIETPDIVLGIYFQLFGGLRVSEAINLSKNCIELIGPNGIYGMNLDLKKRYFRKNIVNNNGKGGVKKPRLQYIMPIGSILPKLYARHLEIYHKNKNHEALFINRNNEAMSVCSYYDKFNRLKKAFINSLVKSENPQLKSYAIVLLSKKWSTHIGRGTFSKLVADYTKNPTELAVMRGDTAYESALPYIQGSFGVQKAIEKVMSNFYSDLLNTK